MSLFPEIGSITFHAMVGCALIFSFSLAVSWRQMWNIFDPLWRTLLFVSINVSEVLFYCQPGSWETIYVVAAYTMFLIGFNVGWYLRRGTTQKAARIEFRGPGPKMTAVLLSLAATLVLIYDGFVTWRIGPGLLSGIDPDTIKVTVTQGGFGIFKYLVIVGGMLLLPLLVQAYVIHRLYVVTALGLIIYLFHYFLFGFSKTGLFLIAFDFGIIAHYYQISIGRSLLRKGFILVAMAIGAIPAYAALRLAASARGITPGTMLLHSLVGLGSGSYMYFCLGGVGAFEDLTYPKKLAFFFDNLLSPLRLKEWEPVPYGAFIEEYLTGGGTPGFGATPFLFQSGYLLLGWGGILYCFGLGVAISVVRSLKTDLITFFVLVNVVLYAVGDPGTAQSAVVAFLIVSPIFLTLKAGGLAQGRRLFVPILGARRFRRVVARVRDVRD